MNKTIVSLANLVDGPPTLDVPTASEHLGISRSHGYALARRGEFPARVLNVGGRLRVVTASLVALLSESGGDGNAST